MTYTAEQYDHQGKSVAKKVQDGPSNGNPLVFDGDLTKVTLAPADGDMSLNGKTKYTLNFDGVGKDLEFDTEKKGAGDISYCTIGAVDGTKGTRDEDCWYPCEIDPKKNTFQGSPRQVTPPS